MPPEISQYLNSPAFHYIVSIVKIVFFVIFVLLSGFIVFGLIHTSWLKRMILYDLEEFFTFHPHGVKKLYRQWQELKQKLDTGLEADYKLAIIEADSILDDVFKKAGFVGETLGEKLEKLTEVAIPNLPEASEAHSIRNNIVHDPDFKLTLEETKRIIGIYEKVLIYLKEI